MEPRLNIVKAAPEAYQAVAGARPLRMSRRAGLASGIIHLIKMRASQINGCAFCLHMHLAGCARTPARARSGCTCWPPGGSDRFYTRPRARRAGLDRGADPDRPRPTRRGRRLRGSPSALQRGRDRQPHAPDHHHQRLEPHRRRLPQPPPCRAAFGSRVAQPLKRRGRAAARNGSSTTRACRRRTGLRRPAAAARFGTSPRRRSQCRHVVPAIRLLSGSLSTRRQA